MPTEEKDPLILAPISDAATGSFAAVMAKASVIYKEYDEAYATKCLEAAKKAWDYLKDKDKELVLDENFSKPSSLYNMF
jgi:endoglucanase